MSQIPLGKTGSLEILKVFIHPHCEKNLKNERLNFMDISVSYLIFMIFNIMLNFAVRYKSVTLTFY